MKKAAAKGEEGDGAVVVALAVPTPCIVGCRRLLQFMFCLGQAFAFRVVVFWFRLVHQVASRFVCVW